MNEINFLKFQKFVNRNTKKIIKFDDALNALNNGIISKSTRFISEKVLKLLRMI